MCAMAGTENETNCNNISSLFNTTANGTYDDKFVVPIWVRSPIIAVVSFLIIASNILNIVVLRRTKSIPHISKMCLTSLSFADLAVGLVTCAPAVVPAVLGYWPYGDAWCQVSGVIHGTSVTVSIWCLAIVSLDRYIALSKPLHYPSLVTTRRCYIVLTTIWILAISTFTPVIFAQPDFIYYEFSYVQVLCGLYWEYPLFCILTGIAIPCSSGSIIAFSTISIFRCLRANQMSSGAVDGSRKHSKATRDTKAFKILTIAAGVYFMCWGPYSAAVIIEAFDPRLSAPRALQFTFLWMANSNSFINVLIYSAVYKSFRHQVKVIIRSVVCCCCFCCKERTLQNDNSSVSFNSASTQRSSVFNISASASRNSGLNQNEC